MDIKKILYAIVAVIGLYMIFSFYGQQPPLLSGIAFLVLGVSYFLK
ncbi:hypothetical protein GOV09_00110 [Candidatus Woesearchaeota archaeon]|nr:hypothetical protein [Candidatus Woesearchaeota archaeon]